MKLCVLLPAEGNAESAGVRIRYGRIRERLAETGHSLDIMGIQELTKLDELSHDVYVVNKCYDARASLAAIYLRRAGKLVGVDLFDNYFSQTQDIRLTTRQYWLNTLAGHADFFLCSTPAMRGIVSPLKKIDDIHVMNDPAPPLDQEVIARACRAKLEHFQRHRELKIAWFGVGTNRFFPVGLDDLVSFSADIERLVSQGIDVTLEILTNLAALTPDNLDMLNRLAVPHTVQEWSEEKEAALLAESLLCYLPVNGQDFSVAKSLNRAVTVLASGTQVLSSGYPLYEALSPFVYRDTASLLADMETGALALREETMPALMERMHAWADPVAEGDGTLAFLTALRKRRRPTASRSSRKDCPAAVVHGKNTLHNVHRFAQKIGALSVASPYCGNVYNFDVRFVFGDEEPGLHALISEQRCGMLGEKHRGHLTPHGKFAERNYQEIDLAKVLNEKDFLGCALGRTGSQIGFTASYAPVLALITKAIETLFPKMEVLISELSGEASGMPWWTRNNAEVNKVA